MKKVVLLSLILLVLGLTFGCAGYREPMPPPDKIDYCPSWPEITTEGLNTFGCKVDGVEWVPCIQWWSSFISRPIEFIVSEKSDSIFLSMNVQRNVTDSTYSTIGQNKILFLFIRPIKTGLIDIPFSDRNINLRLIDTDDTDYAIVDTTFNNFFEISRLDTMKNIVSGIFQCKLIDAKTGKKVEITDGRFDLTYPPQ